MSIKFRADCDLQFLVNATAPDLRILVDYLTKDKDGKTRWNQQLLEEVRYKRAHSLEKVWDLIAGELQLFGGNTITNMYRGYGVPYKEILCDVCNHLDIKFNSDSPAYEIENAVLSKLLAKAWEKMSPEHRALLRSALKVGENESWHATFEEVLSYFRRNAFGSYAAAAIIANSFAKSFLGEGLVLVATEAGLIRTLGVLAGPISIAISLFWTLFSLTGPAYRVTVPCVVQIAYIRRALGQADRY